MERRIISVSELNGVVKLLLDNEPLLRNLAVRGELSNYKIYPSGHHYFTLKDPEGALRCVLFKGQALRLRFRPENGMKVVVTGRVSVFPRDGAYQLYAEEMIPEGAGDLAVAFEQLKARLHAEGLFDRERKKPLPEHPERIAVTGTPVRGDFFTKTPEEARQELGFDDGRPVVVSFWGSLGASHMNEAMLDFFEEERKNGFPFHHIHAVGKGGWPSTESALQQRGLNDCPALDVRQYIYNMATVMRGADLVICRAGASTISELTALGMPAIMVPSPYVTNNHQEKNARLLEAHGGAEVLLERETNGAALYRAAADILRSPDKQARMKQGMLSLGIPDATERIYETVMALVK